MKKKSIASAFHSESINENHLKKAIDTISLMSLKEKEILSDEIFSKQPILLTSILVQKQLGNSYEQIEILLNILFVVFQSLKEAKIKIHSITETEFEMQMKKTVAQIKFSENMGVKIISQSIDQYIEHHPNKLLFTYAIHEMQKAGFHELKHESSKFLSLTGINLITCISTAIKKHKL